MGSWFGHRPAHRRNENALRPFSRFI
jgi:hypothetical protein